MATVASSIVVSLLGGAPQGSSSGAAGGAEGSVGQSAGRLLTAIGTPGQEVGLTAAPERCPDARRALRYYERRVNEWRSRMGQARVVVAAPPSRCPRYLAALWRAKARAARAAYRRWHRYHFAWREWLPDRWQRLGACETGYGRRPGNWRWNSGTYQGAFGFYHGSWDAFVRFADPKAGPYPSEAYLATPRQQYEVALAIWRRYGFSGWGCRGA